MGRAFSANENTSTGVDAPSPAGIGLGALVYNYDGKVLPATEALPTR